MTYGETAFNFSGEAKTIVSAALAHCTQKQSSQLSCSAFSGYPDSSDLVKGATQTGHVCEIIAKPVHSILLLNAVTNSLSGTSDQPPTTLPEMN
jgi:hypothetical protein